MKRTGVPNTDVSLHIDEPTLITHVPVPTKGTNLAPASTTIVPATAARPRANAKGLRIAQSRTDCSISPSLTNHRTSSSFAPAIPYHHANLNRQAHDMERKPVICMLGSSMKTNSNGTNTCPLQDHTFRLNEAFVTILSRIFCIFCSRYLGASA